ncbi:MAG: ribose-phosphate pyrophosphokinase [Planctomycetes bacterium]|nr:ribose-phosphate pyrophosphokinase [Planctomycetota bacterium]
MKLCAWPGNEALCASLARALGAATFVLETRHFPDGESYVRIAGDCAGEIAIVASLDHPDEKTVPLLVLADALRAEGATRVGLIAPYLAYLRQDRQFKSGEAVSSRTFAKLLSAHLDWLVTVDPHLHRYKSLSEVYSIKTHVCHAAPAIAAWIKSNIEKPLLIGPDSESAQWVGDIAARIGAPSITLEKTRKGDRDVEVSVPHIEKWQSHTPVLADDIISTGKTMLAAAKRLRDEHALMPVCIGVHAIFAGDAYDELLKIGARVVTCNAIAHKSNGIDLTVVIAAGVRA